MSDDRVLWQFWMDVGGTFTDCLARTPDGRLLRAKVLSSGVTKGAVADGSSRSQIIDPQRRHDPPDFWQGYSLSLLDDHGAVVATSKVVQFDSSSGTMDLESEFDDSVHGGEVYELSSGEESPILAIRLLLGVPLHEKIPPVSVRLGTTRGTNALITRRGARTTLVTTRGFGDILSIGYQNRPHLFELDIHKPEPLFAEVLEIDERITHDGEVLREIDEDQVRCQLLELYQQEETSLAICLLHAYRHPQHEQTVERIAREIGFSEISTSSHVAPLIKLVARGDTTVVDAYLNPVLRRYFQTLRSALNQSELRILTSAGGLVSAEEFVGKDSVLSGPAGGVVGFARAAKAAGIERAIGFDMGGTSTDVSRFEGHYQIEYETQKGGVRIVAPMMAIETVAAGGGSVCRFDGVKLVVGPESAGANPGPACYGRGGPLAVTDINFLLGKILPERFPFPLDRFASERRLAEVASELKAAGVANYLPLELAEGFLKIANENMVRAIRTISIAQGRDPRDYALVPFGGAAGQHACAVARELEIRQILLHPDAGILSALGIGLADVTRHRVRGVYRDFSSEEVSRLESVFVELAAEACEEVAREGVSKSEIEIRRSLDLRYRGLDAYLTIGQPSEGDYAAAYEAEHERLYGYLQPGRTLEIVALRVEAIGQSAPPVEKSHRVKPSTPSPEFMTGVYIDVRMQDAAVFDRAQLKPGDEIEGPAVIGEKLTTTIIDPGWRAEMLTGGELLVTDQGLPPLENFSQEADPVMLEVFNSQFAGIAEQMGVTLRNTSSSVNVKERLDFSCAIFSASGDLVVNAPHIPVHLGAMAETVRHIVADNPRIAAGDVFVTNDPYRGGSHLPDVTVVTPVHGGERGEILFFTASRAHHAEIGGITPGSMPPESSNLAEEGVLIRNFKLVDAGHSRMAELRDVLTSAPYPSRAVEDNLVDISAQVAANHQGNRDLQLLIERYTLPVTTAYMSHIQRAAETKMRSALARLPDGVRRFTDHMDDGTPISVTLTISGDEGLIDFSGTGSVLSGNLNANRAIVSAAVMYCLRLLIAEDIPLNQGVLAPVKVILPECFLNPPQGDTPESCAAVVGGNVETSQRVVDVLLGALGIAAASQGTMNNLLFGDDTFGYYETICGGAGATAMSPGADAVHTHMTNTRLTDPEVLEQRYPIRVLEFSIRRGSGGAGRNRGGDGVIRRIEFLRPLSVSILSQRRGDYSPYGADGGEPGATGFASLLPGGDESQTRRLPGQIRLSVSPHDVLKIETPGGGGFGKPA